MIIIAIDEPTLLMCRSWIAVLVLPNFNMMVTDFLDIYMTVQRFFIQVKYMAKKYTVLWRTPYVSDLTNNVNKQKFMSHWTNVDLILVHRLGRCPTFFIFYSAEHIRCA